MTIHRTLRPFLIVLACVCTMLGARQSRAQCAGWKAGPIVSVDGRVNALVSFDRDGAGGNPPVLVVGGAFTTVGGVGGTLANNVAAWTGSGWQTLGAGLDGEVNALAVYNSQLYAAGSFKLVGGTNYVEIARWNGSVWETLGSGLSDCSAYCMTVYNGQLIVGGCFDSAGGVTVNNIAAWDGSSWHSLASGLTPNTVDGLTVYNGELIAVGTFYTSGSTPIQGVAAWNGSAWHALGSGVNDFSWGATSATVFNGDLVVAGGFSNVGDRAVNNIAVWNGTEWHGLGDGVNRYVWALAVYNNQLIAGTSYYGGTADVGGAIRWDGTQWLPVGSSGTDLGTSSTVNALALFNGQLAVGGYLLTAGGQNTDGVALWDSAWHPTTGAFNIDGPQTVTCSATWFGQALVGGERAGFYVDDLVLWDGANYSAFPGTLDGPTYAMKTYSTGTAVNRTQHLVIGGLFTKIDDYPTPELLASNIAVWDQSEIAAFPAPAWHAMGPGVNAIVRAIERFNNATIAGGDFTATGNGITALSHIGQWNGTAWSQLGTGLDGQVYALKVFNGSLYAGGSFTHANNGAIDTGGLARWDGTWHAVGGHFAGTVYALEVHNGSLVIGGVYPGIGGSPNIARYDGTSYFAVAPGGGSSGPIYSLLSYQNWLYAGGVFSSFAGTSVHNIARWNGTTWFDVQGGTNGVVNTMLGNNGEVIVGGVFSAVSNGTIRTAEFARFADPGTVFLADQPSSRFGVCGGSNPLFSVTAATHYDNLTYTWRKNGTPVTLGATPWSSYIGTNGHQLQIANVSPNDAGTYDVVVANTCGSVTSIQATLTVCAADFNCSGQVTVQDIFDFLTAWFSGDSLTDFNRNNSLSVQDIFDYLNSWFAGC